MSMTLQNHSVLKNDLRSQHLVSPSHNIMQGARGIISNVDEESDYMEMKGSPASKHRKTFTPAGMRSQINPHSSPSSNTGSPYKGNMFEETDYADMSGKLGSKVKQSPPSVRSPPQKLQRNRSFTANPVGRINRNDRTSTTKAKKPVASSKSIGDLTPGLSRISDVKSNSLRLHNDTELASSYHVPGSLKKNESLFLEGSFYKDDEDDYAEMDDLSNRVQSFQISNQYPKPTTKSLSSSQLYHSPTRRDASVSYDTNYGQKGGSTQELYRNRSGGMLIKTSNDVSMADSSASVRSASNQSSPTGKAGKAARKYLQSSISYDKDPSLFEIKRANSVAVVSSPTRSGGVQSRIHRSRQYQSLNQVKNCTKSDGPLTIQPPPSPKKLDFHAEEENIIDMEKFMAKNSGKREVRAENKTVEIVDTDKVKLFRQNDSFQRSMKKGSDGSKMMKFIAEGTKSKSLDKNYMEWLVKTSPYASRTASTSDSKPKHYSSSDVTHDDPSGTLFDQDFENDDDAFEKYKEDISRHQKRKEKSEKKGSFWNRSKKDKSKSAENLELTNTEEQRSPTSKANKKSRKVSKSKSKKKKETLKNANINENEATKDSPNSPTVKSPTEMASSKTECRMQNINNSATLNSDRTIHSTSTEPKSSRSSGKRQEQFAKNPLSRSRISSSSSTKSLKKSLKQNAPAALEHGATVSAFSVDNLSHKRNNSEDTWQIAEGHMKNHHKRNKSDLAPLSHIKASSTLRLQPTPSSMLDISLSSNYDNEDDADTDTFSNSFKHKYSSMKSNTLGRLFGRKGKERKSLDTVNLWDDSNSIDLEDHRSNSEQWGSFRFSHKNLKDIALPKKTPLPPAQEYMEKSFFVHGFAFALPKPSSTDKNEEQLMALSAPKKSHTSAPINKYATMSAFYSLRRNSPKSFKATSGNISKSDVKDTEINRRHEPKVSRNTETIEAKHVMEDDSDDDYDESDSGDSATPLEEANQGPTLFPIREKVLPISPCKNQETLEIAAILLHCIKSSQPDLLLEFKDLDYSSDDGTFISSGDKKAEPEVFLTGCYARGDSLVKWMQDLIKAKRRFDQKEDVHFKRPVRPTRRQIAGMWQVILEDGTMAHIKCEEHFEDMNFYYGFHKDVLLPYHLEQRFQNLNGESHRKDGETTGEAMLRLMPLWIEELDMTDLLAYLQTNFHDAMFRKALRKQPIRRTTVELKMIYEELLHFNTISHLSESVKRELARVLKFESHAEMGKVLFRQGDEGTCWYIILRGSVQVDVTGKGTVCTLHEGDDFGSLALMNNAPRSATVVLDEPDCHFIRVDKSDYFRILKDVEENTLRLQEHGKDVLVLEKISPTSSEVVERTNGTHNSDYRTTPRRRVPSYSVTAGTPERILEHILEYLQPWKLTFYDETLENFVLMFATFMKSDELFKILLNRYRTEESSTTPFDRSVKRKIVYFVVRWSHIVTYLRSDDDASEGFLKELEDEVRYDSEEYPDYFQLMNEFSHIYQSDKLRNDAPVETPSRLLLIEENVKIYKLPSNQVEFLQPLRFTDQTLMKVYNSEQSYATVKLPLSASAEEVVLAATEKLFNTNHEDLKLVEAQECGDRIELPNDQRSVATAISLNSCLCVCEKRDSFELKRIPRSITGEQKFHFDDVSSLEIAYHVTQYDWHLFNNVHVLEYVYKVFGVSKFQRIKPNLDVLARRFNQLAYWPPTEICSCTNANKRALILRKFIKIALHLKRYQNMNAFMAVMIGIGNQAVSRLYNTWEKLPSKYKKMVQDFETVLDPSRNHHNYRVFASTMEPPYMPYFPLLMKDMTFQHEGNENQKQELVNFEKMHMISSSIRTIIRGCSKKIEEDGVFASTKTAEETRKYVQAMQVITDQRTLNEMSAQLEAKR